MEEKKYHKESMKVSERKHKEQLDIDQENQRLKHRPYLAIEPKHKNHKFEGEMLIIDENIFSIPFKIKNEDAGIAFSIHHDYVESNGMSYTAIREKSGKGFDILRIGVPVDTNMLQINNQSEFCLYLDAVDENNVKIAPTPEIGWEFNLIFRDIQDRKYLQKYSFYTSTRKTKKNINA